MIFTQKGITNFRLHNFFVIVKSNRKHTGGDNFSSSFLVDNNITGMNVPYFPTGRFHIKSSLKQIVKQIPKLTLLKKQFPVISIDNFRFKDMFVELALQFQSASTTT